MAAQKPSRQGFEGLRVYQLSEELSDEVWAVVMGWNHLAKDTVGKQLIRAADSIGANIAEGTGRGSFQDNRRFVRNARGSLYETRHWLRRAHQRRLLSSEAINAIRPLLDELGPKLNAYLRSIGPMLEPTSDGGSDSGIGKGQRTKDKGLPITEILSGDDA
jgi:four helix bundle protein